MAETEKSTSKYWLDLAVAEIMECYPKGEIIVSSGISPSASYHIGHFREILTADALAWGVRQAGRKARHIHVVDNFDPLRRRYDFLPESFEQYVGWPICLVPDPFGDCHGSYATHFFKEFEVYFHQMGAEAEVVFSYQDLYKTGRMAPMIEAVLTKADKVRQIFEEVSKRQLPKDWTPVQVLGKDNRLTDADINTWDNAKHQIGGRDYSKGEAKLNWRLDWPARWKVLGVMVEPFSAQEHGAKGGSFDTGAEFARQIFESEPPLPAARYANIHLPGDTIKMSSSKGNLVTPEQALEIMPPEILRYFVLKSRPAVTVHFDSGLGLYNLIDEYSQIEDAALAGKPHPFERAYQLARAGTKDRIISSVPFSHLVAVSQAARGDFKAIISILERTGYKAAAEKEKAVLKCEINYVEQWLLKYAPDKVKFSVQDKLPQVELSGDQKEFLSKLAEAIEQSKPADGQAMHEVIYDVTAKSEIKPSEAFQAIYRVILGKDSGPKAGWFLASLEHDWLVQRLNLKD